MKPRSDGREGQLPSETDASESLNDTLASELQQLAQERARWDKWIASYGASIAESYARGETCLHLHFGVVDGVSLQDPEHECAVFNVIPRGAASPSVLELKRDLPQVNGGHDQGAVLVDDGESIQEPERIIPSSVRLQSIEECQRFRARAAALGFDYDLLGLTVLHGLGAQNRELSALFPGTGDSAVLQDQRPSEVVKSGPEVVENISRDDRESKGWWRIDLGSPRDTRTAALFGDMVLMLSDDAVWIGGGIPRNLFVKEFQMLVCSDELFLNTCEEFDPHEA